MEYWNFNENVLTKFWASTFYLALKNTDVIQALNSKMYNFLENVHQNTPAYQSFTFYLEKYQSYKAFHVSHYAIIMTSCKP